MRQVGKTRGGPGFAFGAAGCGIRGNQVTPQGALLGEIGPHKQPEVALKLSEQRIEGGGYVHL